MSHLRVFFSHVTIEAELAELIRQAILRDFIGLVDFFISSDVTSIPAGQKWLDRIVNNMGTSDLHFVLCSPSSINRHWISVETGAACMRRIDVIPICHSGLTPAQLPLPLAQFQAIEASSHEGLTKLYNLIASKLSSSVPGAGVSDLVRGVTNFERAYVSRLAEAAACSVRPVSVDVIVSPRVLCVSSKQFLEEGLSDLEMIVKAFPTSVAHRQAVGSSDARSALDTERYDVVHVATYICSTTGDLVFSNINTQTGEEICQPTETLTADAFARLVKKNGVRLVVIASCESLKLAAKLRSVTNVIGTQDMVSPQMFAAWIENFYSMLPNHSLSDAFRYAVDATRAPMTLYAEQELVMTSAPAGQ